MRLFVALVPPAAVLDDLDRAVGPHRAGRTSLRWSTRADWHVTLAFLGEVTAPVADQLGPELARAARRHGPLSLAFSGAGAFPDPGWARVLWCGLDGDRRALTELAALAGAVAAAARQAGAPPPDGDRAFRPHLTLARARRGPAGVWDLVAALTPYQGPSWPADRVHLIQSRPGGQPRYTTIGDWPLGPGPGGDTLGS
jgi:RNA 2',3'-cyclic 3'-phosphodiesterase